MEPRTPTTVTFVGAKGGVGTSTIAVAHAFRLGRSGHDVRLTATDPTGLIALSALVAPCPPLEPGHVVQLHHHVTLADHLDPGAWNVVDGGTHRQANHPGLVLVVVRNNRMALQGLLSVPQATRGLVMVKENGHRPVDEQLQRMCGLMTWARHFGTDLATDPPATAGLLSDRASNRIRLAHPVVAETMARRYVADAANEFGLSDVGNLPALDGLEALCHPDEWPAIEPG
jgi:hypothetical protein